MAVRCGEPKRQRWGCDQRETSRGTRAGMSILGHQGLQPSSRLPPHLHHDRTQKGWASGSERPG